MFIVQCYSLCQYVVILRAAGYGKVDDHDSGSQKILNMIGNLIQSELDLGSSMVRSLSNLNRFDACIPERA